MNHCTVVTNEKKLMLIGGFKNPRISLKLKKLDKEIEIRSKECFVLEGTKWIGHSTLLEPRSNSISICMPNGIYVFGGMGKNPENDDLFSSEFLATGTSSWKIGPNLPSGADFLHRGRGVAISETEMVLMGGYVITEKWKDETWKDGRVAMRGHASKKIWKFNTVTEEWKLIGNLKVARYLHQAVFIEGNIIVSGGRTEDSVGSSSTEIFNPHQVNFEPLVVNDLNVPREYHLMGKISKHGIPTVIAFGGYNSEHRHLDSIEQWDKEKRKWELLEMKLFERRLF